MTTTFVTTIKAHEVPAGGIVGIDVRGTRIAIANVGGTYYAFDDTCTHEQCSLAEGDLAGTTVDVYVPWRRVRQANRKGPGSLRHPFPSRSTAPGSKAMLC